MSPKADVVLSDRIERSILLIRGHKVMIDSDLAQLSNPRSNASGKTESEPLSIGFYVPVIRTRGKGFEITDCDVKAVARGATVSAVRFHGTRGGDALERVEQ